MPMISQRGFLLIRMTIDYSLMFVTDERIVDEVLFLNIVHAALKGGVSIVQLREKKMSTLYMYKRACAVQMLCRRYAVPFIVNDRVDIALAVGADGVHMGQTDMPVRVVRKLLGSDKVLGLSISSEREMALFARSECVDYLGVPVFTTTTKIENVSQPVGLEGLTRMSALTSKPLVAIGGITAVNAHAVIRAGAQGIAVVSEISQAESPLQKSKILRRIVWKNGMKRKKLCY